MPPRSTSDATRFTATVPHAAAKSQFTPSNIPIGRATAPAGETPQQKIARLRAAAAKARLGQESQFDKVVRVGRVWADRAHRVTALSLIGLTVVCGVVASFAIGDMLIHNRRKRNEWLAEQQLKTAQDVAEARRLVREGVALNEDQILLLNRERAADEAQAAKLAKKGILTSVKESLFGGLSEEEVKGGKIGAASRAIEESVHGAAGEQPRDLGIVKAVEEERRRGEAVEQTLHPSGGPLDKQATEFTAKTKSWTGWVTGR